jgi:hypothetical protein
MGVPAPVRGRRAPAAARHMTLPGCQERRPIAGMVDALDARRLGREERWRPLSPGRREAQAAASGQ